MNIKNHLFEFEDLSWFPGVLREGMTDYLRFMFSFTNFYLPVTPLLADALVQSNSAQIIDLCAGAGGPIENIKNNVEKKTGEKIQVVLTDKYPNLNACQLLENKITGGISYCTTSVDAGNVPPDLKGFRTIFSGFHHFGDSMANAVLKNAVDNKCGIGIFDGADKNIFTILMICIIHPVAFLLLTPFIRPFRFSRILFTYIVPLIPLCTIWDGIISIIRLRTPNELLQLTTTMDDNNYVWKAGKVKNNWGFHVAYLIGYPKQKGVI